MGDLAQVPPELSPELWYQSRSRAAPCGVRVTNIAAAPGDEGGIVTPIGEAQSLHVRLYDDPNKPHFSLVVQSELSRMQSYQLTTALVVIEQAQGLDLSQGLCFMTHVFLMYWDWKRAQSGEGSLLDLPRRFLRFLPDGEASGEGKPVLFIPDEDVLCDFPVFGIQAFLDFWTAAGARWSAGFTYGGIHSPDIDYTSIPPGNVNSPQSWEGFVRPRENWALDLENLVLPAENAVMISFGDQWFARFDGKTALLNDSKGLTYIRYLLAESRVRTVYDVLRDAGDLQDDPLHTADEVVVGMDEFDQIALGAPDGYIDANPDEVAREQIRATMATLEQAAHEREQMERKLKHLSP